MAASCSVASEYSQGVVPCGILASSGGRALACIFQALDSTTGQRLGAAVSGGRAPTRGKKLRGCTPLWFFVRAWSPGVIVHARSQHSLSTFWFTFSHSWSGLAFPGKTSNLSWKMFARSMRPFGLSLFMFSHIWPALARQYTFLDQA